MREAIETKVDECREEMLSLLERLVNMDSFTHDTEDVNRVGDVIAEEMSKIGMSVTRTPVGDCGDVVTGHLNVGAPKRLLLIGHRDTVLPKGTAAERPFTIRGDTAYGPGVADMKGGLVVALYAVRIAKELGFLQNIEIEYLCNGDEEIKSTYSMNYIAQRAKGATAALVYEGGGPDGAITTARKGGAKVHIEVYGKAAHSGGAFTAGISAGEELARKVSAIHALTDLEKGSFTNAGLFGAGTHYNIVPDRGWADIDLRFRTQEEFERLTTGIQEIVARTYVEGTTAEYTLVSVRPPMERTAEVVKLYQAAKKAADLFGFELPEAFSGGGSDANECAAAGIPVIDGLGPSGGNAHKAEEFMIVPSVFERVALSVELLRIINQEW